MRCVCDDDAMFHIGIIGVVSVPYRRNIGAVPTPHRHHINTASVPHLYTICAVSTNHQCCIGNICISSVSQRCRIGTTHTTRSASGAAIGRMTQTDASQPVKKTYNCTREDGRSGHTTRDLPQARGARRTDGDDNSRRAPTRCAVSNQPDDDDGDDSPTIRAHTPPTHDRNRGQRHRNPSSRGSTSRTNERTSERMALPIALPAPRARRSSRRSP